MRVQMTRVGALVAVVLLMMPSLGAQETFSRVTRDFSDATLTVFDGRPLQRAAQTLAHNYGIRVSVEDPLYLWEDDLFEARRGNNGQRSMAPKPVLLEVGFRLDARDNPSDVPALLQALIDRASLDRPFGYRIDEGPGGFTLVPTRMRNEHGGLVNYASPLDTVVTLPQTVKPFAAHVIAIRELVEAASGDQIACCTQNLGNFDFKDVESGVDHESARHALQRLGALHPYHPVVQHMRCQ